MTAGNKSAFTMRLATAGDIPGIIECIRSEYGDTYFVTTMYDAEQLKKKMTNGDAVFMVAEIDGNIVSSLSIRPYPGFSGAAVYGALVVKPEFRGRGVAKEFVPYGAQIIKSLDYTATYVAPFTVHTITQRSTMAMGFVPCGFDFATTDNSVFNMSFKRGKNKKFISGLGYRIDKPCDMGLVYVPRKHAGFISSIYEKGTVKASLETGTGSDMPNDYSDIRYKYNDKGKFRHVFTYSCGSNFLREICSLVPPDTDETVNVYLKMSEPSSLYGYGELIRHGFHFSGFVPVTNDGGWMILHNPNGNAVYFDDIITYGGYSELISYIKENW